MQSKAIYSLSMSTLSVIMLCPRGHGFTQLADGVLPPSRTISQRQSRMPMIASVTSEGKPNTYAIASRSLSLRRTLASDKAYNSCDHSTDVLCAMSRGNCCSKPTIPATVAVVATLRIRLPSTTHLQGMKMRTVLLKSR